MRPAVSASSSAMDMLPLKHSAVGGNWNAAGCGLITSALPLGLPEIMRRQ